jgi:hypothetical protein
MSTTQVPDNFWLLADPSQEVLVAGRPAFSQLGPVLLSQTGGQPMSSGELRPADVETQPER